jgi:Sulfotransferase family
MKADDIRITDLASPVLSDLEKHAMASARPVEMDIETMLAAARAETGLTDFGPDDFRERLAVWLKSFDEDRGLNALGRASVYDQTLRYAVGRLRIEDLLARHPEILQVKIDRPLLIAGLPRSGTTHLVNVLGTSPELRSMPLWETMEPVPKEAELSFEDSEKNPRYRRCIEMWQILTTVLRYWSAMHEMEPDHIHEEVEIQCYDFSSYMPEWIARVPRWQDYYYRHDQTPHYAYARKVIQAMTWFKGPNRWVMKSPPNMENLPAVFATYPDATVVITHRDPVAVIQSAVTMVAYWDRIRRKDSGGASLAGLAEQWIGRIERLLRACVRDRDTVPQARVIDVMFHEYMADQRGAIDTIYRTAKLPRTAEVERRINEYLTANPRGKLGRVIYDLQGDFGVDVAALRRRFQFYYDRFPVKQEPVLGERRYE